ncbi:methyltransferase [Candidatus Woesearchaeota archaeon]|nr:methyltransferase [Candidatus Woesearchaeota archaeon]
MVFIPHGAVITHRGTEDISAAEIKELISAKNVKQENTIVTFEFKNYCDLAFLTYKAQSVFRVFALLNKVKIDKSLEGSMRKIKDILPSLSFKNWLRQDTKIKVDCIREGTHDFSSVDIAAEITKELLKHIKNETGYRQDISNKDPDVVFLAYICDCDFYFGIDFSGIDLSKRDYKIFIYRDSLKGTLAYSLLRMAEFKKDKTLIDPFMGTGIIPIEAAIYAGNVPLNYYRKNKLIFTHLPLQKLEGAFKRGKKGKKDIKIKKEKYSIYGYDNQLRNLKAAQKNAKIAGVHNLIQLSKVDVEWLDTKFNRRSVNLIVTDPPYEAKYRNNREIQKTINELFYQADFVLEEKGRIVLLTRNPSNITDAALKHNFKLINKRSVFTGKLELNILHFVRGG